MIINIAFSKILPVGFVCSVLLHILLGQGFEKVIRSGLVLNVPNCVNLGHFKTRLFNIKHCFILKIFSFLYTISKN